MNIRILKDNAAEKTFRLFTWFSVFSVLLIGAGLYFRSLPVLQSSSLGSLLWSEEWKPYKAAFGFLPFILGTLWVTAIAILLALPLSLLAAIYLSEYASYRVRQVMTPLIDLLAGIPPVIYGVWGVLVIVPFIQETFSPPFVEFASGYSALAGGVVLAIMIVPLIVNILIEVFSTVPQELKDASLSVGATHWQTVKKVLLKKSLPGIIAATVLAVSRAFGETIAVLMVCGNMVQIPHSVFDSCYPLPALIANNYGEMMSVPMYDSALMLAAFILFVIIFLFNAVSRIILYRLEKKLS